MDGQFIVKTLLIASFVFLAFILLFPRKGARPLAIRRLTLLLVFALAVMAVIRPDWVSSVAAIVGVGRGADLLLYTLVVVFAGQTIASSIRYSRIEQDVTEVARHLALLAADPISTPPEVSQDPERAN